MKRKMTRLAGAFGRWYEWELSPEAALAARLPRTVAPSPMPVVLRNWRRVCESNMVLILGSAFGRVENVEL